MKVSKELIKGSSSLLILSVLKGKDLYGYKIIKELELRSENAFEFKEGTLYPILHALEKEDVRLVGEAAQDRHRRLHVGHELAIDRDEVALPR